MNTIDLVLILPLAWAIIAGFRKGFIIEVASLVAFVLAIIACLRLTHKFVETIATVTGHTKWLPFLCYILVFLLVYILVLWLGKIIEKGVNIVQLGLVNRLLGMVFSLLKVCFFISLFFWMADMVHLIAPKTENGSYSYKALNHFAPGTIGVLSHSVPWVKGEVADIEAFFDRIGK